MSSGLNKSIVEDAALSWFGGLGYAIGHSPKIVAQLPCQLPCQQHMKNETLEVADE